MRCVNCEAKWETKNDVSTAKCPFCGENPLVKKEEPKFYETSKDALAAIFKKFGADVLLGKLNAYLPDFAPSLNNNDKNLVYSVNSSGASKSLKENLNGTQEDKERAAKIALRTLIEAYLAPEIAKRILFEFTDALGWQIEKTAAEKKETVKKPDEKKPDTTDTVKKPNPKREPLFGRISNVEINLSTKAGSIITFGKYDWNVLDTQSGRALIITKDIIEQWPYNTERKDVTWETCTLRGYLNGEFLKKFSPDEQSRIIETRLTNSNNKESGAKGGNETSDKIFLLSLDEADKYYADNSDRMAIDKHDAYMWYWLRSPGGSGDQAALVNSGGSLFYEGVAVHFRVGFRPALWLKI